MAFVRSGHTNLTGGGVANVGSNGYDWSRTANSSTNAYRLNFNPTDLNMNATNRYWGFPLRWVWPRFGADLSEN